MKRLAACFALLAMALPLIVRAQPVAAVDASALEAQVTEAVKSPKVTIVHFWATWCPNCKAELTNGGWRDFVAANPDVNVIFVCTWDPKPGTAELEKFGLTTQQNFTALHHPNVSRKKEDKMSSFIGLPVSWIPTTWVFRDGVLRYALNYGELSFPMLQQMVRDSTASWKH